MSSSVRPTDSRPCSSRKWSTTPASAATSLPARSSIELIDSSTMMASLPAELSLTITTVCAEPDDTPTRVSFSVWLLASIWPAAMASSDPM